MLDWVTALLDQNLLLQLAPDGQNGEGESRFGMLETTREYGLECLAAVGELGRSWEREATDFPALETRAGRGVTEPNRHAEPATLDIDHDSPPAVLEFGHGKQREDEVFSAGRVSSRGSRRGACDPLASPENDAPANDDRARR